MSTQILAINDGSIWQSKTKLQYDDQPDWTSYQVHQEYVGIQRLNASGRDELDKYKTTTDEIVVYDNEYFSTNEQAHFSEGQDIFIVNDENPNGKRITLGERTEIVDKGIRHQPSLRDSYFLYGHSLSVETPIGIRDYNDIIFKDRAYIEVNRAYENGVKDLLVQDSPFGDDTYSVKKGSATDYSSGLSGNITCDIELNCGLNYSLASAYENTIEDSNRYISFFYKRPSDVDLRTDDDGNLLPACIMAFSVFNYNAITLVLSENVDGGVVVDIMYIESTSISTHKSGIKNLLNDGEWHHIVLQASSISEGNFYVFVDNELILSGYNENFTKDNIPTMPSSYKNLVAGIFPLEAHFTSKIDSSIAPEGCLISQVEIYQDSYDPDEDDYLYLTRADDDHTIQKVIKYDISNEGLESTPIVYKVPQNKIYCSMAPDADSIEDNFQEQDELEFSIRVEDDQLFDDVYNPQPIDTLVRKYDTEDKSGRAFATKIECNFSDIIKPGLYVELSSE